MKVLVTGGTGFVGSHAVAALREAGHELRLLARSREKVERVLGADPADVVLGDMGDPDAVARALSGCDAVVHAAATVGIARASTTPSDNAEGIRNVVGRAVEMGLDPVVQISSVVVLEARGAEVRADDPVVARPLSAYARSKAEGERYCRALQETGAPVTIVYPSGVYGPDDPGLGDPAKGLRDRLRFGWLKTRGGSACVDVRDLARVIAATCEPARGPRRYMAGGHFLPWAREADLVEGLVGRPLRRFPMPVPLVLAAGRAVDLAQRLWPGFDYPLTYEAAILLTRALPCDNGPTIRELGVDFRPTEETLGDAIAWLVAAGHLDPEYAPKLGAPRS